jgi:hypothetical protein
MRAEDSRSRPLHQSFMIDRVLSAASPPSTWYMYLYMYIHPHPFTPWNSCARAGRLLGKLFSRLVSTESLGVWWALTWLAELARGGQVGDGARLNPRTRQLAWLAVFHGRVRKRG